MQMNLKHRIGRLEPEMGGGEDLTIVVVEEPDPVTGETKELCRLQRINGLWITTNSSKATGTPSSADFNAATICGSLNFDRFIPSS